MFGIVTSQVYKQVGVEVHYKSGVEAGERVGGTLSVRGSKCVHGLLYFCSTLV